MSSMIKGNNYAYKSMKTIKKILASSDELEIDRARFGDFIRRLDEIYERKGNRWYRLCRLRKSRLCSY